MQCVDKADIKTGTRVLVRGDLDVPLLNGEIVETVRLDVSVKTLNFIIDLGGFPIVMGHMGRPEGKKVPELSTHQLKGYFDNKLHGPYQLLENLRFDSREEKNDPDFARELSSMADIYVNECFSTSHRACASIVGVPALLPCYAGFRLVLEVESLEKVMASPIRPFLVIIGGAKIETKKPVIEKFAREADAVLVGGKLALEQPIVLDKVFCPVDYIDNKDIGEKTTNGWKDLIKNAKTIVWSGPMGAFEDPRYSYGTKRMGEMIVSSAKNGCFVIAGGGDTVSALLKFDLFDKFGFVSMGGGAMLDFLILGILPGLTALGYCSKQNVNKH